MLPIARAFKEAGAFLIGVVGFRDSSLVFWDDKFREVNGFSPRITMAAGEKIGLGAMEYKLKNYEPVLTPETAGILANTPHITDIITEFFYP